MIISTDAEHALDKVKVKVSQSCLTLRPHGLQPTRLLHRGIFQARVLEWVAIAFSTA